MAWTFARAATTLRTTWVAVAAGVLIVVIIMWRSLGVPGAEFRTETGQNETPPSEPARTELAGGFSPIPEFGATYAEMQFRGVDCVRELSSLTARLYHRGDIAE